MFADIHTHNIQNSGFPAIINIPLKDAYRVLEKELQGTFSVGIHPFFITEAGADTWSLLELCMADKRFVALGECGLDKNCNVPPEIQKNYFIKQISISEKAEKPLIIHCVGMFNELIALKKQLNPSQIWIVHGFRAKPQMASQLLRAGIMMSFGDKFNEQSVLVVPANKIFIETDESTNSIRDIYQKIAKAKHCTIQELNAGNLFYKNISE